MNRGAPRDNRLRTLVCVAAALAGTGAAPAERSPASGPAASAAAGTATQPAGGAPHGGQARARPLPERSFAIRAKAIYPVTRAQPCAIEDATLIVRGGKIVALGRGLEAPRGMDLIHLPDAVICPGFVSAASNMAGTHGGDQTVSAAYRAVDAFDSYGDFKLALANGVTTVHLDPGGHRLVSGVGAVVKFGGPAAGRVLNPAASLCVNLDAFDPPPLVERPFYASSDVAIEAARRQRPESRLGRFLELNEQIRAVAAQAAREFDYHGFLFAEAWRESIPLRVQVRRAADITAALQFLSQTKRSGCLVGLAEGDRVISDLLAARLPLVLRIEREFRFPGDDIGPQPDATRDELSQAGALAHSELQIALAGTTEGLDQPQLVGALALRGGMSAAQVLAGLTRVPAEILGLGERLGTLEPGRDADFVILSGPPLQVGSSVLATYVDGVRVFEAPRSGGDAVVVKGGTLWVGDGTLVRDGSLLIKDGKIAAVGQRVPTPPFARVIDAGPSAFITPGFIDAHSHLGLGDDRNLAGPELAIDQTVGVTTREFVRVARAGVTTVLLSAYRVGSGGGRVAAVKTAGTDPQARVAREIAGLRLDFREQDPLSGIDAVRQLLERGKKYVESWKKYQEELDKWKADQAAGRKTVVVAAGEDTLESKKVDPISGTWEFKLTGGPLPEAINGTMRLRLTGNQIEGRATVETADEEAVLNGTLDGDQVKLEFDEDTGIGKPVLEARLDREDHMAGKFKIGDIFELELDATRTSKEVVEFKVTRKRRSKGGGPTPPTVDEALEPVRAVLEGKASAVVSVREAAQAAAVMQLLVDEYKISLVLLDADEVAQVADELLKRKDSVGVVPLAEVMRWRDDKPYNQAADLASRGIRIAFGSNAEDAARNLPLVALFAVQKGLGGDAALRALTSDAAKMFKLEDRIGSLAPGTDGDVLIFSGHPFDAGSRLERVLINGSEPPPLEEAP